jgi:hypothetical protein
MDQSPGPVRCPTCGQRALPMQSRCLSCNARLREAAPVEKAGDAIQTVPLAPLPPADGKCPGCARELPAGAVLCIDCGYDSRTGRKRETVHALVPEEAGPDSPPRKRNRRREPLPAGLARVQLGLGFHYARLVLTLLAILVLMGLMCYGVTVKPGAGDPGLIVGGLATLGLVLLAAVLGILGSVLCLWVGRASGAWGFVFTSLLLDGLTLPLAAYLQIVSLPPLIGWVVQFVSWILFMLFLGRLARYLDRPGEANELMALITWGVALLVGVPLLLVLLAQIVFLSAAFGSPSALVFLMISTAVLAVQFIFLVKLFFRILGNIQTLRATIASRLPQSGRENEEPSLVVPGGE